LHSFTRAVSTRLARDLRKHDVGLVFTYHTPTVSCQRGTLLRWGRDLCDGTLDVRRCSACTLQSLGIERRASALLGAVPPRLGRTLGRFGLAGGAWTGLRMTDLTRRRFDAFHRFMQSMDRIVVLCRWSADLLCRNGVETDKVVISRHGLAQDDAAQTRQQPRQPRMSSDPLRVAFLGRLHPTKGVDTLVHAIRALPEAPLVLDIFGIGADAYADSLRALGSHDPRIRFRTPLATHDVIAALTNYDVVAVPSRWMETGPLVVLEAFAAGTPVVGSRLGGIAELVTDGVDGLLLDADAVLAWTKVLARLIRDVELLQRLRAGIRPPRRMDTVAAEMLGLYHDLKPAA
jgi:glycosyltransferase involved in cell wall biosynthesis